MWSWIEHALLVVEEEQRQCLLAVGEEVFAHTLPPRDVVLRWDYFCKIMHNKFPETSTAKLMSECTGADSIAYVP